MSEGGGRRGPSSTAAYGHMAPGPNGRRSLASWGPARRLKRVVSPIRDLLVSGTPPRPSALRALGPFGANHRPLFVPAARLVVCWSTKSACTHVVGWCFERQGLLAAAQAYHQWPHDYRIDVHYRTRAYWREAIALTASDGAGHTLLRVTRDPEARLVSIFRHAVRSPRLWPLMAPWLSHDIAREGLSLEDFDRFLSAQDLGPWSATNEHFCRQSHPVWEMAFDRKITINLDTHPLHDGLAAVDADLGLGSGAGQGSLEEHAHLRALARAEQRYATETAYRGKGPIEARRFRRSEVGAFPKAALLASPLLQDMARRHYAADEGRVATGDTAGRLFATAA